MFKMSEKKSVLHKIRENPWILSSVILGIILTIFIINNSFGGVSGNSAGQKLVDFLNKQAPSKITLEDVSTESGLYKVNVLFQDQSIPVYATKDGKYFIQSLIPIEDSSDSLDNSNSNTGAEESATETEYVNVSADDDAVKGDSNAPVTIIEFSDYECPFCGRHFQQTLPQIISEYVDTGKVKIVFRDFPLGFHTKAQKAAEAAECAGDIGGDKKYLYGHKEIEICFSRFSLKSNTPPGSEICGGGRMCWRYWGR